MRQQNECFFEFAWRKSLEHRAYFLNRQLTPDLAETFRQMAQDSISQQKTLEAAPQLDFATFLAAYASGNLSATKN